MNIKHLVIVVIVCFALVPQSEAIRFCSSEEIWDGCYQLKDAHTTRCIKMECYTCINKKPADCTEKMECTVKSSMSVMNDIVDHTESVYYMAEDYMCISALTDDGDVVRGCLLEDGRIYFAAGNRKTKFVHCTGCYGMLCNKGSQNDMTAAEGAQDCFKPHETRYLFL